jgi:hypothetical protein
MVEALQQGTIDIYVGFTGPVGNFSPSMLIVDIPSCSATLPRRRRARWAIGANCWRISIPPASRASPSGRTVSAT